MKTLLLLVAAWAGLACADSDLERRFAAPPDSARPWVYWYFMDGNMTREGLTADLEAMRQAGIGGAIFLEVGIGVPRGPVEFMSPEWLALFHHAVAEADRLGIEVAVGMGPGWCGSGGPWVKPELSMQHTVASETFAAGPSRFDAVLPRPQPRVPFFGMDTLTPELKAEWQRFYRDVAVLAFPTPKGSARLPDAEEKALYYRAPYSSQPGVKPRLPSAAEYPPVPADACVAADQVLDLTKRMDADGRLAWDVPEGSWTILRVGRTLTGQTTRPAPAPGLGFESDKFSASALDAQLAAFTEKLLAAGGERRKGRGLTTLHFDSWEMSSQNGSETFWAEFGKRRRYEPLRYLPALTGRIVDSRERTERFLWDVRQTAQELMIERYVGRIRDYAHKKDLTFVSEPYDMNPCCDLEMGKVADVPMCEFWSRGYGFDAEFSCFEAVSVAHTMGRPVVAAEAFTANPGEDWRQHPASMKSQGDWALCCGINRFAFHRFQHQPRLDRWPGMTMGPYGVYWDRTQTWWGMVGAYHTYVSRCQEMLRQGLPVADILYLEPEGAPQVFRPPASATEGELPDRRGYNFDGCAPGVLLERASVRGGRIAFPGGASYRVLVLPRVETMTPQVLQKIAQLVKRGATVVGLPPKKSPSLADYPQCDAEVQKTAAELWGDGATAGLHRKVGKGEVIVDGDSGQAVIPVCPLTSAKWIWYPEGQPAASAPKGVRYFSRAVMCDGTKRIAAARAWLTADNAFALSVNGRTVGRGDNFHQIASFDVTALLKPGANELAVQAENVGDDHPNPAGLIGALAIVFADGSAQTVLTDGAWGCSLTPRDAAQPARVLGDFGCAPWSLQPPGAPEPELYPDYFKTAALLAEKGVSPDFESDGSVRYTHRSLDGAELYFIANREPQARQVTCRFRVAERQPEWWDPITGARRALPQFACRDGVTSVPLRLEALQSVFVVFRKTVHSNGGAPGGRALPNCPECKQISELTGPWQVTFDPKWLGAEAGGQKSEVGVFTFETLQDWTQRTELGIKCYSGTAVYRKTFDAPASGSRSPASLFIDLGDVKNMASVALNGQPLGTVWCAPWRVRIPEGQLRERGNELEVRVANLWINRLIGDAGLPPEKRLTWTTYAPYRADSPLQPSGLLGPVVLREEL